MKGLLVSYNPLSTRAYERKITMSNDRFSVKEMKELSTEKLISILYYNGIKIANKQNKTDIEYERKIAKVLAERLNLDWDLLLKELS